MFKVRLIVFSKLKSPGLRESCDYYLKLLSKYARVDELELKPEDAPDKSPATRNLCLDRELGKLREKLDPKAALLVLDEQGSAWPTLKWSSQLEKIESSHGSVDIVIGSHLGVAPELRKQATHLVCLGPQTLSHELARVVLAEQLFRAIGLRHGHPYHVGLPNSR